MEVQWVLKKFNELTPAELYAVLQLRSAVFVVEQNCVYLDADNNDQPAYHLLGLLDGDLVAYTRLLPPGVVYQQASIGRVVTSPRVRRTGIGRQLMTESISQCKTLFGDVPIKIGAQYYLKKFYTDLGFTQVSDIYLEDGIEHIHMLL